MPLPSTGAMTQPAGIGASPATAGAGTGYGVAGGSFSGDANSLYTQVTQSEWQNYLQNFVPIENQLISFAQDPNKPAQAMAAAQTNVDQSMAQQPEIQANREAQYGIKLDNAGQQAAATNTNLTTALAGVDAQNRAKDTTIQQQQSIIGSPVTGLT